MYSVDIACNRSDNGLFCGKAHEIHIGLSEFEPIAQPATITETVGGFRLSGKNWKTCAEKYGVGNWCWNRYCLSSINDGTRLQALTDFAIWLRARKTYQCNLAGTDLFEWFNDPSAQLPHMVVGQLLALEFESPSP